MCTTPVDSKKVTVAREYLFSRLSLSRAELPKAFEAARKHNKLEEDALTYALGGSTPRFGDHTMSRPPIVEDVSLTVVQASTTVGRSETGGNPTDAVIRLLELYVEQNKFDIREEDRQKKSTIPWPTTIEA